MAVNKYTTSKGKDISGNWHMKWLVDNGYDADCAQAIVQLRAGTPEPFYPSIYVGDAEFEHRVTYAAAGATQFTFFNVGESKNICSLPGNGAGLPRGWAFLYTGMAIAIETGTDVNGAADADGSQIGLEEVTYAANALPVAGTVTDTSVPSVTGEQLRRIFASGDVNLFRNGYSIDRFNGLYRAPQAGGAQIQVSMGGTTTAEKIIPACVVSNGDPVAANRRIVRPQLVIHNQPLKGVIDFNTALALTCAGVIKMSLLGTLVKPLQ